jgi:hypothetical protein
MDMIAHNDKTVYSHALIFNAEIQTINNTIPIVFLVKASIQSTTVAVIK